LYLILKLFLVKALNIPFLRDTAAIIDSIVRLVYWYFM